MELLLTLCEESGGCRKLRNQRVIDTLRIHWRNTESKVKEWTLYPRTEEYRRNTLEFFNYVYFVRDPSHMCFVRVIYDRDCYYYDKVSEVNTGKSQECH